MARRHGSDDIGLVRLTPRRTLPFSYADIRPVVVTDVGFPQWAVRDLNPRPLACHEPWACSGPVARDRFRPLSWSLVGAQFTDVQLDSLALLTWLLTRGTTQHVENE